MSIISPADLEASPLADLHALASALSIDGYRRLRKSDLVDAILTRQGAAPAPRRARNAAPARAGGGGAGVTASPSRQQRLPAASRRPQNRTRSPSASRKAWSSCSPTAP